MEQARGFGTTMATAQADVPGDWLQQPAVGAFAVSGAAGLVGPHGDLDAVSGAEFSHEAGEVGFDGAGADVKVGGDLTVGAAVSYQ